MTQTASESKYSDGRRLYLALELGWRGWKLAFSGGPGQRMWMTSIAGRDVGALRRATDRARRRLEFPEQCQVISCYEAGRDGFWLDRFLRSQGICNRVVDSSSIQMNRRARRIKTDRIDASKLLSMLMRYEAGERGVFSVVRVPSRQQEDARHLHRELRTLKKEQTRSINRIKGLLASQGVDGRTGRRGLLEPLDQIRIWDGTPLPEGLHQRLETEIERHALLHRQVLCCEARIKRTVQHSSETAVSDIRRLSGLRAIGRYGATVLVREFGWRDFRNRRQVGALSGLTPTPFQSGQRFREGGISRSGNRHVRGVIVDLAWGWLRLQPDSDLSIWYRRRFGNGSSRLRRIGIVALARRLLIALWRYWAEDRIPQGAQLKRKAA